MFNSHSYINSEEAPRILKKLLRTFSSIAIQALFSKKHALVGKYLWSRINGGSYELPMDIEECLAA